MNYSELVVSKNPLVYVSYNDGTNIPSIGETHYIYTSGLNPIYDYTAKQHGLRSKKIGHAGSGGYDYRTFSQQGMNGYQATKYYYHHQEFWIYFTIAPTSSTNIGGYAYANVSPLGTYTTVAGSSISSARQILYVTGGTGHSMTSVGTIPIGAWTHVALQFDNGVKRIYINGVLDSTATVTTNDGVNAIWTEAGSNARVTTYIDEIAHWGGMNQGSPPANFPTAADILERATFPRTTTKVWSATNDFWIASGDERYWNGSAWISMQQMPYRVWNGTDWVQVPSG